MQVRNFFISIFLASTLACGAEADAPALPRVPAADVARQGIIRGTPTGEQLFAAVGALVTTDERGRELFNCTATLIAPDLILTAAHCLGVPTDPTGTWQMWFSRAQDAHALSRLRPVRITHTFAHPVYDPTQALLAPLAWRTPATPAEAETLAVLQGLCGGNEMTIQDVGFWQCVAELEPDFLRRIEMLDAPMNAGDVGLALLEAPLDGAPLAALPTAATTPVQIGTQLTAVGYGTYDDVVPNGANSLRHFGAVRVDGVGQHELQVGFAKVQLCSGDSGGPLFLSQDNTYTVLGVASRSMVGASGQCLGPTLYAKVHAVTPWIRQVAREGCRDAIRSAQICRDFPL